MCLQNDSVKVSWVRFGYQLRKQFRLIFGFASGNNNSALLKKEALRPLRFRKPLNKGLVFLTWLGVFLSAVASPVKAA